MASSVVNSIYLVLDLEAVETKSNALKQRNFTGLQITQIAWRMVDIKMQKLSEYNFVIKSNTSEKGTTDIKSALTTFYQDILKHKPDYLTSYNLAAFDYPLLMCEVQKSQLSLLSAVLIRMKQYCLMRAAMSFLNRKSLINLKNAYKLIVGKEILNWHDALADVITACELLEKFVSKS